MDIVEQSQGAVSVLRPSAALTGADAQTLRTRLMEAADRHLGRVLLDASAVAFVDSQGLEALVEVSESLGRRGQVLRIAAANETLREVLSLTGWAEAFEHFDDVNSGVRSFL